MNRLMFFLVLLIVFGGMVSSMAQSANGPVDFQPGPDLQKRYASPSPRPGASKQSKQATIGRGKTMVDTGDPKNSFWNEPVDLNGAGNVLPTDMLWDASSRILYAFAHTNLRCTHGKSIETDVLVGIYGKHNFLGKTPGSGWWVVNLVENECQVAVPGLYGCKFDSQGNTLACGRAELDPRINDMAIVESTKF